MKAETRYLIELRPIRGNWPTPPILRLRAFLKAAKRAYGLKCVSAKECAESSAPN
jgi:hypothetical protein